MGLKAGQAKMSKSDPDSAVFMEESEFPHGPGAAWDLREA